MNTNATTVEFEGHVSSSVADPDPGGQKEPTKKRNKLINFIAGCSLLRAEGFFCSLNVL